MSDGLKEFLQLNRFEAATGIRSLMADYSAASLRGLLAMSLAEKDGLPGQQLLVNDQLTSNNGLFDLAVRAGGNLALDRSHFGRAIWSPQTAPALVDRTVMQADGNLVAWPAQGGSCWSSGTVGHPGACLTLRDDGDLVVHDGAGNPLWRSNSAQNLSSPTFSYRDERGYAYVETSESWKEMCGGLPCFIALQWPDYASTCVETKIDGDDVVIQLWKGWCQKFLGMADFPGGIGAEVGVYRRISGRNQVDSSLLSSLPAPLVALIEAAITLGKDDLWWPFPELQTRLEFTLINPITQQVFFTAGPETSYWLAKWMNDDSYDQYQRDQGQGRTPGLSEQYVLDYRINGTICGSW